MPLTESQITELSQALMNAQETATPITNVVDQYPDITIADAYAVHKKTFDTRISNGDTVIGRKIGLSSKAAQEMFNADSPAYGNLFASMLVLEGEPISMSGLCRPMLEGETAFVLKNDLKGPGATPASVMASIAGVMPAFENRGHPRGGEAKGGSRPDRGQFRRGQSNVGADNLHLSTASTFGISA